MKLPTLNFPKKTFIAAGILVILIALASIPSIYFYSKYQETKKQLVAGTDSTKDEVKALVDKVGKLILLPQGETPEIAVVTDLDLLKGQPFFALAKTGDKVLVYKVAKKAILYDPIANRIVEVGPVMIATPTPTPAGIVAGTNTTTNQGVYTMILLNGTTKVGATNTYEKVIKTKVPTAAIVDKDSAKNSNYTNTILVDVTGSKKTQAEYLAKTLGIILSTLPSGETKPSSPSADFLIIVGADNQ